MKKPRFYPVRTNPSSRNLSQDARFLSSTATSSPSFQKAPNLKRCPLKRSLTTSLKLIRDGFMKECKLPFFRRKLRTLAIRVTIIAKSHLQVGDAKRSFSYLLWNTSNMQIRLRLLE
ncbi:hypothetical protein NPIL_701681 [Nephila pilipes]|uniref:Uncharacterized protein n=1 Tax=Nephila pilipes TaxID=299642 RepID=A0A8X6NUC2_NEPPI|nr:hypothetical protein NPIL_701681 [Nephila pilipes]